MSLQTIEIEAFSGPTSVLIGGGNQPTIVYINQGPAGSSGSSTWGSITGTLSSQTDLQDALDLKANLASPTFTGIVTAPRIEGKCAGLELFSKAGQAINAGQVVYVTGASGTNVIIGLAQANTELTSSRTIGVCESTLANNATGYVITEGLMTVSISAPTANEGDPIWLSGTTAGGMLFGAANKPVYPYHQVYLGVVTRKTGNTIVEIYVKVQNGFELDEISDVLITDPLANQALVRNSDKWINRALVSMDISDSSYGGNNLADFNKLAKFNVVGGLSASSVNKVTITQPANFAILKIGDGKTINAQGSISTSATGSITTNAGGSFATGTGNLTGPNASGTVALINPSSGTQTFSEAQNFSGQVELTGQAATNPTSAMTRALVDERVMPQAHLPSRFVVGESDFTSITLNTAPYGNSFTNIGAPGGTSAISFITLQCSANHPGVIGLPAGNNANSGAGVSTGLILPIVFDGGEEYTLIFKPVLDANTTRCRIGFSAPISTAAPNYIAYAEGVGDGAGNVVFSAITANFSGGILNTTTNATTYSAALGVWYKMIVAVNASAASVSFYLYSESGTLLWSVTNSTNIPTSNVQVGFTFYNTTILAGTILAYADYHKFEINRTLIR